MRLNPPTTTTITPPPTTTSVRTAIVNPTKTASPQIADIGDIITYTITVPNTGNIAATNVIVTDPIPSSTTFIPNSVTINGTSQPGVNPSGGIQIGTIAAGNTVTVTFQVQVTSLPENGPNPKYRNHNIYVSTRSYKTSYYNNKPYTTYYYSC
ncbi:DUF11 domain-containing protein [Bacillus pacificus]